MSKTKKKNGRPTKFKVEYCDKLIEHMSKGYSFETFGPSIGVATSSTYRWLTDEASDDEKTKHNKEMFREAKKRATDECRLFWERMGIGGAMGRIPGFNVTAWIFNMKNRFTWRDKVETVGEVKVKPYIIERPGGDSIELGLDAEGLNEDHS